MTNSRRDYVVAKNLVDRHEAIVACESVLDLVRPRAACMWIDAVSDYGDDLPPDIRRAQDWLRSRGERRGQGDSRMGADLDPNVAMDWAMLRAYAAWSIHVELHDAAKATNSSFLAALYDGGQSRSAQDWMRARRLGLHMPQWHLRGHAARRIPGPVAKREGCRTG